MSYRFGGLSHSSSPSKAAAGSGASSPYKWGSSYSTAGSGGGGFSFGKPVGSSSNSVVASTPPTTSPAVEAARNAPRVAIVGTGAAAFQAWWAIHVAGLRVRTVVLAPPSSVAEADHLSLTTKDPSLETGKRLIARCVEYYGIPSVPVVPDEAPPPSTTASTPVTAAPVVPGLPPITPLVSSTPTITTAAIVDSINVIEWAKFTTLETPEAATNTTTTPVGAMASTNSVGVSTTGAASAALPPPLQQVDVIYFTDFGELTTDATRAALLLLIRQGKHLVIDPTLSSSVITACIEANFATCTKYKKEMRSLFLYRGGGEQWGWPKEQLAPVQKAIGMIAPGAASAVAPAADFGADDDGFSAFSFMSSAYRRTSNDADAKAKDGKGNSNDGSKATPKKSPPPLPPSTSEIGRLRRLVVQARFPLSETSKGDQFPLLSPLPSTPSFFCVPRGGAQIGEEDGDCLGVLGTVGWIGVSWVLQLMSWRCPSVVLGQVLTTDPLTGYPLSMVAQLYFSTARLLGDVGVPRGSGASSTSQVEKGEEKSNKGEAVAEGNDVVETTPQKRRQVIHDSSASIDMAKQSKQPHLCITLHIGQEEADGPVVQQVRAIGTAATLVVDAPFFPHRATHPAPIPAAASSVPPSDPSAAVPKPLPLAPKQQYRYTIIRDEIQPSTTSATAGAPKSSQRRRVAQEVVVPGDDVCAEARLWMQVRARLSGTAKNVTTTGASAAGAGGGRGYSPYAQRYGMGGRGGYRGSYYGRGGMGSQRPYGGIGSGGGSASSSSTSTAQRFELNDAGDALKDAQHAWLIQVVVEKIKQSAALQRV